jgi:hypothetical protein
MRIPGSDFRTHNGHPAPVIRHDSDGHFRRAIVECFQPLVKNPNEFGARDPDFSHAPLPAITEPSTNYTFARVAWPAACKHPHTRPGQKSATIGPTLAATFGITTTANYWMGWTACDNPSPAVCFTERRDQNRNLQLPQPPSTHPPPGRTAAEDEVEIVAIMAMNSKTANKLWTPEEDKRLKSLIETSISLDLVAAKLQRSVSAVKNRAHVLKISVKRTSFGQRAKGK